MQKNLKTAIRFDDFYDVYGTQGVVAMAWLLGSLHVERIRAEQCSFPFLYITGRAGSGKTSLLSYLWTLKGLNSVTAYSPEYATQAGLARILTNTGNQTVILETGYAAAKYDWEKLTALFSSGIVSSVGHGKQSQVTFSGAVVICANPPIECSKGFESRTVRVNLTAPHTIESRHHIETLHELSTEEAGDFYGVVARHEEQLLSTLNTLAPAYTSSLLNEHADQLTSLAAKNGGQLMALIDVLSVLLNLDEEVRRRALNEVKYSVCSEFVPY